MYKEDLALNNLQWLMGHKIRQIQPIQIQGLVLDGFFEGGVFHFYKYQKN